jgi:hypothetical protein
MRLPLLIVLLTLMSPCDRLWAQTDPFVGNWRLVPEESRFSGVVLEDVQLKFVFENGQLRWEFREHRYVGRGAGRGGVSVLQFDGQEHPFELTGETNHRKHTVVWKRIDDHTVEGRINHDDGKEYSTERLVISPDGRKLTRTLLGQRSDGPRL